MTTTTTANAGSQSETPWRSAGFWMGALIALLMGVNTFRAFADPIGFATYMGLPLKNPTDIGFVHVYGLRAAFLGLFAAILLARQDMQTLKLYALAALVMPLGDALLTWTAGAPTAIVGRHIAIMVYLAATAYMLHRWTTRHAN
jgi:Domain of unknown function (DUF4267)